MKRYDNSFIDNEFRAYDRKNMSAQELNYIEGRIIDQIKWYDSKSVRCQKSYMKAMVSIIIINGFIPLATLTTPLIGELWQKIWITSLSSTVTVLTTLIALKNWQNLWVQYRSNCEILKSNLHKYFTGVGEYSIENSDRFCIFMESCEKYMTQDRNAWEKMASTCNVSNQSQSTGS